MRQKHSRYFWNLRHALFLAWRFCESPLSAVFGVAILDAEAGAKKSRDRSVQIARDYCGIFAATNFRAKSAPLFCETPLSAVFGVAILDAEAGAKKSRDRSVQIAHDYCGIFAATNFRAKSARQK